MGLRRVCSAAVAVVVLGGQIAGCGAAAHGRSAVIRVSPSVGLYDAPRSIVVSHLSPGSGRHTAVIVWGGSEGGVGVSAEWAGLLASHGIAALALAYFDEPGLPCALNNVPLEYFVKAIRWLRSQPRVDPGRVWILSGSRGSEAELLVAAHWPTLVHGVVAEAPSSVVYRSNPGQCRPSAPAAWTLQQRLAGNDPEIAT